jgi:hypothetical protein
MPKYSVIEYRNQNDFKYGNFEVFAKPNEVIISGLLKKSGSRSRYLQIRRNK